MIAAHKTIQAEKITSDLTIECSFIKFKTGNEKFILGSTYIAPGSNESI